MTCEAMNWTSSKSRTKQSVCGNSAHWTADVRNGGMGLVTRQLCRNHLANYRSLGLLGTYRPLPSKAAEVVCYHQTSELDSASEELPTQQVRITTSCLLCGTTLGVYTVDPVEVADRK